MAAASYYTVDYNEEYLESQALEINQTVSALQARIRGFLRRPRIQFTGCIAKQDSKSKGQARLAQESGCLNDGMTSRPGQVISSHQNLKSTSGLTPNMFDDPEFTEKRFEEMPDGWSLCRTQNDAPYFYDSKTKISTRTHPRQHDASLLFSGDFKLTMTYEQWCVYVKGSPQRGSENPTVGELGIFHGALSSKAGTMTRWWKERDSGTLDDQLCNVCRHIDFDAILHSTGAWKDTIAIDLGVLRCITKKTRCAFCRLVVKTLSCGSEKLVPYFNELVWPCHVMSSMEYLNYSQKIRCLYLTLRVSEIFLPLNKAPLYNIHQIVPNNSRPQEQSNNDSRLLEPQIDFDLVRSWMQMCEQQHHSMSFQSSVVDSSFRIPEGDQTFIQLPCQPVPLSNSSYVLTLIDVCTSCLVDLEPDARYIALSYVWGGPQPFENTKARVKELHRPGAVSRMDKNIPQTIRDAMAVVEMLGERYLWVDSLCIVQDSSSMKKEQISNMGNIYSQATLTIVAAYGNSCHAGLPGVRSKSRHVVQHVEEIDGMLLSNELRNMHDYINHSFWNTRGWTYQERELSKRCLFFTNECVLFSCNQMVCREDSGKRNISFIGEKGKRIRAERHPIWNNYRRAIKNFSKRRFTFDEDVVNAFEGIASLLQPAFRGNFVYGLPETELDLALLWQPASSIRRRINESTGDAMFPSWSWAGWIGEIDYVWTKHVPDDLCRVQWQVQGPRSASFFMTSEELRAPRSGQHEGWTYSESESDATCYYKQENSDIWYLHPTAAQEARVPCSLLLPDAQELRFKAYTAVFRIAVKPHVIYGMSYDELSCCTADEHVRCPVEVISADGFVAGTVYVPSHMETLISEPREVVCLSRRRGCVTDSASKRDHDRYRGNSFSVSSLPQPKDDFAGISKRCTLYPSQVPLDRVQDRFDHIRYNKLKPWSLYNVMLIEHKGGKSFRVAIGIIHVTAFIQANPVEKLITLG